MKHVYFKDSPVQSTCGLSHTGNIKKPITNKTVQVINLDKNMGIIPINSWKLIPLTEEQFQVHFPLELDLAQYDYKPFLSTILNILVECL